MVSFPMAKLIFVVVLGLILASEQHKNVCPEGWEHFNDRCFQHFPNKWEWGQAETFCVALGGNLASVHSAEEYHLLKNLSKAVDPTEKLFWIGLTDCQKEGTWRWSDGSQVDYTHWARKQPNNFGNNEDCALSVWSGKWNDFPCGHQFSFSCAKHAVPAKKV